eukprot:5203662-Pyramimonas_sp.AAC.1
MRGVPKWVGANANATTGAPSVELPMGPRSACGVGRNERGAACQFCHWGLRWSSLWGHETCQGCGDMGGADACEPCHWGR